MTITLYRNGFAVADDPVGFRSFDDPNNRHFLDSLKKGEMPKELEEMHKDKLRSNTERGVLSNVRIRVEDKSQEDFKPPAYIAFSGTQHKLGGNTSVDPNAVAGNTSEDGGDPMPEFNPDEPSTTLQIILVDGRKLIQKFNMTHTIKHVQSFIASQGGNTAPYTLLAGFPPKPLTDFDRTIEEAKLKNARVTQKLV